MFINKSIVVFFTLYTSLFIHFRKKFSKQFSTCMNHMTFSQIFFDHHFDWNFWTYVVIKINFSKIAFLSKYCIFQWIVILISSCSEKKERIFHLVVIWKKVLLISLSHWRRNFIYLAVAWKRKENFYLKKKKEKRFN